MWRSKRDLARRPEQPVERFAATVGLPLELTEDVAGREVEENVRAGTAAGPSCQETRT